MDPDKLLELFPTIHYDTNLAHYQNDKGKTAYYHLSAKFGQHLSIRYCAPTETQILAIFEHLGTASLHFVYIKNDSNQILYVKRVDNNQYNIYILQADKMMFNSVVTTHNSAGIIAFRFYQQSLFDGRSADKRYLKKENWHEYPSGTTRVDPLFPHSFNTIGRHRDKAEWVHFYFPEHWEIQIHFLLNELNQFQSKIVETPLLPAHQNLLEQIVQITEIQEFICQNKSLLVLVPTNKIIKKTLATLPYPHRFLNEAKWVFHNPTPTTWTSYSIHVFKKLEVDLLYSFKLKNPSSKHVEQLSALIVSIEKNNKIDFSEDLLSLARPMKHGEKSHRSILLNFKLKKEKWYLGEDSILTISPKTIAQKLLNFLAETDLKKLKP